MKDQSSKVSIFIAITALYLNFADYRIRVYLECLSGLPVKFVTCI